ncbi:MAG: hypothetical protein KatS3mg115_1671 [Candidatus Poribacteria bacterium]|nr:MAG: hypothetical protein KatS3mg115_1671 [Candidatus Poribacteria bacterium]
MAFNLRRLKQQAYFGCLTTLVVGLALMIGLGAFFWWRWGGLAGIQKEFLVRRTLRSVQELMLKQRPDGVTEAEIERLYTDLNRALTDDRVDLERLYVVLKDYLQRYHGTGKRPSTVEMQATLEAMRGTILPQEAVEPRSSFLPLSHQFPQG